MKKLLLALLASAALAGCGRQERLSLEEALLEKMRADSELKDYKISPEDMTACVVEEISSNLPVLAVDVRRGAYFEAYAKFISATNPLKAIEEEAQLFGSVAEARKAAMGVTDHIMTCMGRLIDQRQPEERPSAAPAAPAPAAPAKPAS
jgi:hypothetical protein